MNRGLRPIEETIEFNPLLRHGMKISLANDEVNKAKESLRKAESYFRECRQELLKFCGISK